MNSNRRLTATTWIAGLLFLGYLIWGYATFIDGEYLRKIAEFHKPHKVTGTEVETPACDITHRTIKMKYRVGELVTAEVNLTKYRNIEAVLQWNLMDARFYPYAARRGAVSMGHHHLIVDLEKLPAHIPPGKYYFKGLVKYETNPVRDIYMELRTNEFEVTR